MLKHSAQNRHCERSVSCRQAEIRIVAIQIKITENLQYIYFYNVTDPKDLILTWIATLHISGYAMKRYIRNDERGELYNA